MGGSPGANPCPQGPIYEPCVPERRLPSLTILVIIVALVSVSKGMGSSQADHLSKMENSRINVTYSDKNIVKSKDDIPRANATYSIETIAVNKDDNFHANVTYSDEAVIMNKTYAQSWEHWVMNLGALGVSLGAGFAKTLVQRKL